MAQHSISLTIDVSQIVKYVRIGQETMFIEMSEENGTFEPLESLLNLNGIDTNDRN